MSLVNVEICSGTVPDMLFLERHLHEKECERERRTKPKRMKRSEGIQSR